MSKMNILETIKQRHSTRTYNPVFLSVEDKQALTLMIENTPGLFGRKILFSITENRNPDKVLKLNYGGIKGHCSYLLGSIPNTVLDRVNYGYQAERILLQATDLGLASCWIGYFDPEFFSHIELKEEDFIPSIIILGYAHKKRTAADKLSRIAIKGDKRKPVDLLFFDNQSSAPLKTDLPEAYMQLLEMVRLAPSAKNLQPWRIFYDKEAGQFHFYKEVVNKKFEESGVHDIDMGIAAAHFELAAEALELKGEWSRLPLDEQTSRNPLQYILSWKREKE